MKKYVISFMSILTVALLFTVFVNYFFDRTGILNVNNIVSPLEPSQHFLKMRYVLDNPYKYDAFAFGSSRLGNVDFKRISNGNRYYNMTYSAGLPKEWLNDIKMMLENGIKMNEIVLALDDFSFRADPKSHEGDMLRVPYKEDNRSVYWMCLFKMPKIADICAKDDGMIKYDIYDSGRPLHPKTDEDIEADYRERLKQGKFAQPSHNAGNRIGETMNELTEIKRIADENGIKLIVWYNPVHHLTYEDNNLAELKEFKKHLAYLTGYWDFSEPNSINDNDIYWYETSHFRVMVGDMIVNRVYGIGDVPSDFGRYVECTD